MNEMIENAGLPGLGRPETFQMCPEHMRAKGSQTDGTEPDYGSRFFRKPRIDHKMEWPSVHFCAIGTQQCYE